MKALVPVSSKPSLVRMAFVFSAAASEPDPGSVRQ
jgi:hypothetical protein